MAKKQTLEQVIEQAAKDYAILIVNAVKSATLEELIAMPGTETPKRRPGRPPKSAEQKASGPSRKRRVVKNYPKCQVPDCNKNRFIRGKGFCGTHWKEWQAGKIAGPETYQKAADQPGFTGNVPIPPGKA